MKYPLNGVVQTAVTAILISSILFSAAYLSFHSSFSSNFLPKAYAADDKVKDDK
jgi:hypothetical protein